ncbi:conserved hypothetical protein [Talaromyces stipitatus ATCC 10500]|uniref:Uncharacterized protein n=1 Tax=Talaromyces stipitatus (strain ATCC 10500 / CBS 375.48 / QM 6759 / NRRL 1006) TaxID=441959 RepID=B8MDP2_TALSN|nr:uncharacterized protein TSTA_120210 [Talaromyces stipitatus ATCC 10500]EED18271.1 conserved hypothetical protein [Talaromyces stipitatus ATCC 10500]
MAGRKRKAPASNSANSSNEVSADPSTQGIAPPAKKGTTTRSKRGKAAAAATSAQSQAAGGELLNTYISSDTSSKEDTVPTEPPPERRETTPTKVPQATRFSTRLKARKQTPAPELPPQASPESSTGPTDSNITANNIQTEQSSAGSDPNQTSRLTPKSSDTETIKSDKQLTLPRTRGRKRKLEQANTDTSLTVAKKAKVAKESAFNGEVQGTQGSESNQNESAEMTHTEDGNRTGSRQNGTASGSGTTSRGKGGRKKKGNLKNLGSYAKKGKGNGGKKGKENEEDSDIELDPSLPLTAIAQKLSDRQKVLKQNFKKLGATHKLILSELAARSHRDLARDKNAHLKVPEFEEVNSQLQAGLQKRLDILENEHRLRVQQADIVKEAETQIIQTRYEANAFNIQDEIFHAAAGEYMQVVEGQQHAGDEEHTEPDVDGPQPVPSRSATASEQPTGSNYEHEPFYQNEQKVARGYTSKIIRKNAEARAAYESGKHGADDFLQRAKLNEISQEEESTVDNKMKALLHACEDALAGLPGRSLSVGNTDALSALADAASTQQPMSAIRLTAFPIPLQSTSDQQQLPSFMQPEPQMPPPRRPSLPPSRGFPDVFTMGTRRQLPPLQGGPLPRYGSGQQHQFHPVPAPAPPARTPANMPPPSYFYPNNSHGNPYQCGPTPPPPPPPSAPPRRY